jgi:antitoxin VapB
MAMNIMNEEARRLALELSALTGESLSVAVTGAIRERLERVRSSQGTTLAVRLLHIGKDCAAHLKEPFQSADHGNVLYDEMGLPRPNR